MSNPDAYTQLNLFEDFQLGPLHLSRMLPLWDLLPLFLYTAKTELSPDTPIAQIPVVQNVFKAKNGEQITVDVKPAILRKDPKAPARIIFPGEREQLVSAALRALAVRSLGSLGIKEDAKAGTLITMPFTIRQLRLELAATKHSLSHVQVRQALDVLQGAIVTVTRSRDGQESITQPTPYFYSIMFQGDKCIATLNPIESSQILSGAYRVLDYTQLMAIEDPVARWIFQYIMSEHLGAHAPDSEEAKRGFDITLELLYERAVLSRGRRVPDLIKRVRVALSLLAKHGVLYSTDHEDGYEESLQEEGHIGRRKIVGGTWKVFISERIYKDILDGNTEAMERKRAESRALMPFPVDPRRITQAKVRLAERASATDAAKARETSARRGRQETASQNER